MGIYLAIPFEIDNPTPEQHEEYLKLHALAGACYAAYGETLGILAIFSRKRRKHFKQTLKAFNEAREAYSDIVSVKEAA